MRLEIKIFTGETSEKYMEKFKRRAGQMTTELSSPDKNPAAVGVSGAYDPVGHTFKKMITAYENGLK